MANTSSLDQDEARRAGIRNAADELATRLATLADTLAATRKPTRLPYGPGRLGNHLRRLSPEGFVLDPSGPQVLMSDGRLWAYSRSDSARQPAGRFYDARVDYAAYSGSRTFPGGTEFVFLGAVLGKYTFGFAARNADDTPGGLCAIYGDGRSVRQVTADQAFSAIAEAAPSGHSPGSHRQSMTG